MTALVSDLRGNEEAFLAFEALASAAHNRFVFDNADEALTFQRFLFRSGVAEFCPPAGRLLTVDGTPAGMLAVLSAASLRERRLRAALALNRDMRYSADVLLQRRLQLAAATQCHVGADDAYLARIAVHDRFSGRGLGQWLLEMAVEQGRTAGARRLVLDVAIDNGKAIACYTRFGFEEVGRASVTDQVSGRAMDTLHFSTCV